MTSKNNFRTGRLDKDEMFYIETHYKTVTAEMMAESLNRRPVTVNNYIKKIPAQTASQYLTVLMDRPAWKDLKDQFTEDELNRFADEYHGFVEQFRGEILHSEEGQMLDAIKLGILASRKLKEEKGLIDIVRSLETEIEKERKAKKKDREAINDMQHDLVVSRQLMDSLSKQAGDFIKQKHVALEKMKATRNQRTDISASSMNTNYKDWIRKLVEDADKREAFGKHMERGRLAMDAEYDRLRRPHTYMDQGIDLPILNTRTLELLQQDEENEELQHIGETPE